MVVALVEGGVVAVVVALVEGGVVAVVVALVEEESMCLSHHTL